MIVLFREEPFSVDMRWIKGARRAKRISYVAGRWSKDGRELAHIDLNGVLAVFVPGGVKRDIHGKQTMAESRKPIDRFGFKNTLDAIIEWCERARHEEGYRLTFGGEATFEGRSSYVFERWLPPAGEELPCPDRRLVVFIDREWLLPTGSLSYSDDSKEDLLGRYVLTDVEINVGLIDADFE